MKTISGVRCDSCGKLEVKYALTVDKRPFVDSRDRYFDFVIPPNKGFRGVASAGNPKQLAALHACPPCKPKVLKAMKFKDPSALPPGPLRDLLEQVKSRELLGNIKVN